MIYLQEHLRQLDGGAAVLDSHGGESGGHFSCFYRRVETRVRAANKEGEAVIDVRVLLFSATSR